MTFSSDPDKSPEDYIKTHALNLGFDQIGITSPDGIGKAGSYFQDFFLKSIYFVMT